MNPNYARWVQAELDNLLGVGFIHPIKFSSWLSPIVVVPKKNGQIRVYVDYHKLNAETLDNPFPPPFTDAILDTVAWYELYRFLDGFSGYNQVRLAPVDQDKTIFFTYWGEYVVVVMMLRLKTVPVTFQRAIMQIFEEFIPTFMQVLLDDFAIFSMMD